MIIAQMVIRGQPYSVLNMFLFCGKFQPQFCYNIVVISKECTFFKVIGQGVGPRKFLHVLLT